MYKNKFLIVLSLISLISCADFLKKKQKTSENIVSLDSINFNRVDAYPLLPECEDISSRTQQEDCFYNQLSNRIETSLSKMTIHLSKNIQDTIFVKLQISEKGKINVSSINLPQEIRENNRALDSLIMVSILEIPQILPAIKSGVPVTSEFTLPIVISAE